MCFEVDLEMEKTARFVLDEAVGVGRRRRRLPSQKKGAGT
jgi:hypothetical protein